jgi:hypothetical protein
MEVEENREKREKLILHNLRLTYSGIHHVWSLVIHHNMREYE